MLVQPLTSEELGGDPEPGVPTGVFTEPTNTRTPRTGQRRPATRAPPLRPGVVSDTSQRGRGGVLSGAEASPRLLHPECAVTRLLSSLPLCIPVLTEPSGSLQMHPQIHPAAPHFHHLVQPVSSGPGDRRNFPGPPQTHPDPSAPHKISDNISETPLRPPPTPHLRRPLLRTCSCCGFIKAQRPDVQRADRAQAILRNKDTRHHMITKPW